MKTDTNVRLRFWSCIEMNYLSYTISFSVKLFLFHIVNICFCTFSRQDVWGQDHPSQQVVSHQGDGQRQQAACQAADERIHGVGARGETQDPEGVPRHAQLQHQQDTR